jgi:protein transport protein SEC31
MVRLREIPRTAAFAWSPGPELPLVVTGTRAGAVDADFSDETKLELWDLGLDNLEQGVELQPVASISTDSRYESVVKLSTAAMLIDVPGSMILLGHQPTVITQGAL